FAALLAHRPSEHAFPALAVGLVVFGLATHVADARVDLRRRWLEAPQAVQGLIYAAAIVAITIFGGRGAPFLYFQFGRKAVGRAASGFGRTLVAHGRRREVDVLAHHQQGELAVRWQRIADPAALAQVGDQGGAHPLRRQVVAVLLDHAALRFVGE